METNQNTPGQQVPQNPQAYQQPQPSYQPDMAQRLHHNKTLVAIVAVLGVTVMALAAALVVNRSEAQPGGVGAMPPAAISSGVGNTTSSALVAQAPVAPVTPAPVKTVQRAPVVVAQARPAACASCGTVEAVTAVQKQGQVNGVAVGNTTIGLGTVAGGVVGGLLGNQVGGRGNTAATVLGVAGGAFAGNAIEKNMKKVTVYEVRVRMDDGSTRHMEVSSAVPVGSRVTVEGKNLRLA